MEAAIRLVGSIALFLLVTVLAAVAVWAGLHAWRPEPPRFAGDAPDPELPAAVEVTLDRFPRPSPRVVDAAVELRSGATPATGTVVVRVDGEVVVGGPDRVAILDATTGVAVASAPLPAGLPAALRFEQVPEGRLLAVVHRDGESPRRAYLQRVAFELDAHAAPQADATVALSATAIAPVVLAELAALPVERVWSPVSLRLRRPDDPQWCTRPAPDAPRTFEPGSADLVFEFAPLGPGRYEVEFVGFEPSAPVAFELPATRLVFAPGLPAR